MTALRFHHIVMQNLVARHPGKQVVLKSPGHLFSSGRVAGDLSRCDLCFADPVAAVQTIYEKIDLNFTDQARGAMQSWLADPANRPPKGHHMLAQYGLDEAAIDEAFGDYMRAYGIRPER